MGGGLEMEYSMYWSVFACVLVVCWFFGWFGQLVDVVGGGMLRRLVLLLFSVCIYLLLGWCGVLGGCRVGGLVL